MNLWKSLFLTSRFFYLALFIAMVMAAAFAFPFLFVLGKTFLVLLIVFTAIDILLLFNPALKVDVQRSVPVILSLGEKHSIGLKIHNQSGLNLRIQIIEELPYQLQDRENSFYLQLPSGKWFEHSYEIKPLKRGEYTFGDSISFIRSFIGLAERTIRQGNSLVVPVYPSILQMKRFELNASGVHTNSTGVKKLRRIGHSYEFEQIKAYVPGDDYRSINWKATGRKGDLMVNQYEDEKAQQIFNVIDKSRVMRLPFNGLTLLDHAINTSLVLSNVALNKSDKAGLITFAEKMDTLLPAQRNRNQLKLILEALYKEEESRLEANYELLYLTLRNALKGRCMLMLYTNFENPFAMRRVLPVLRKINRQHLLVVVFFENSELQKSFLDGEDELENIYQRMVMEKYLYEKQQMVQELKHVGITSVFTTPEDLTINTINKYLELKSRGLI